MSAVAVLREDHSPLARYDRMLLAIADAKAIDEVKNITDTADAMRAAARVAKNKQSEIDLAEIRFRGERRLGELMAAQRQSHGTAQGRRSDLGFSATQVEEAPITLTEAGIDKNLADRARKYAAIPEAEFNDTIADWRERVEQESERVTVNLLAAGAKHVRGTLGTGENEWYTPAEYLDLARAVIGPFDLDPASSEIANRTVEAATFYSEADNGLDLSWHGAVWLNPPYAQPAIGQFIDKAVSEFAGGDIDAMIVLTHNYTDTRWFQTAANAADAICFTRGRVKFEGPEGEIAAPTQGQAFFYFGPNIGCFHATFSTIGFVVGVLK